MVKALWSGWLARRISSPSRHVPSIKGNIQGHFFSRILTKTNYCRLPNVLQLHLNTSLRHKLTLKNPAN